MLKKLLKYDWKFFWKVPATINLALFLITMLGVVSLLSPLWEIDSDIIRALMVTSFVFYYVSIFAGSLAVNVYIAIRFYRNIYTDEGYLTNTLPVTPRQIILSKLLISVLWSFITGFTIVISIFILLAAADFSYGENVFLMIFRSFFESWREILQECRDIGFHPFSFLFLCLVNVVAGCFFNILMLFSAISLGQMFTRHKIAGAIVWYFAEYMAVQFASSILMGILSLAALDDFYFFDSVSAAINPSLAGSGALTLLGSFGLYCITEYMLTKKLNLD